MTAGQPCGGRRASFFGMGGGTSARQGEWTDSYDKWVHAQHYDQPATEAAFRHHVATLDARCVELQAIDSEIERACTRPPLEASVASCGASGGSTPCRQ